MKIDKELLNKAIFTTINVIDGFPILQAFHDNNGDWQFFSYKDELTEENARVISLGEILEIEKTLENVVLNLPKGYEALRDDKGSEWYFKYDSGVIKILN